MPVQQATNGTSTTAQRQAIAIAGKARGLAVDDIRALTPAGSIRALTFEQASALLDRLNGGRPRPAAPAQAPRSRRRRPGVLAIITDRQREVLASYQGRLGWSNERLDAFMQRTFGLTMATLASRRDASRAITILRRVIDHKAGKDARQVCEHATDLEDSAQSH